MTIPANQADSRFEGQEAVGDGVDIPDPVLWDWPTVGEPLRTFDKYSEVTSVLAMDAQEWTFMCNGRPQRAAFSLGADGSLQRQLARFTQNDYGPASLSRFLRTVVPSWGLMRSLLMGGPLELSMRWKRDVKTIAEAVVAKAILRKAAELSLGPWHPKHQDFISAMDSNNAESKERQFARLRSREHMLPTVTMAGIVGVLDEAASEEDWDESDLEGLCALACTYQFGVRPVQLITLLMSEVFIPEDADNSLVAILTFYTAKRGENAKDEPQPRTVRPEWVRLFERLQEAALLAGRSRLFKSTISDHLVSLMHLSCRLRGRRLEFRPGTLRHTAAQTIADDGHARDSLQQFLGHARRATGDAYYDNTARSGELLNRALGASVLYGNLLAAADIKWISVEELDGASEDEQIGGVVGGKLVAGIGRCARKQTNCRVDPVVSCYGCGKFLPVHALEVHVEAYEAMRAQVLEYAADGESSAGPAIKQLEVPLARVQQHIAILRGDAGNA